jgi:succinate dehydrogenase/fumarate reductase flavoprotein subunit
MTAALMAHDKGANVLLLEKSGLVGGTTAVSGGVVWVPNNHRMDEVGHADTRDAALGYVRHLADGRVDEELITAFIDNAPRAAQYLEEASAVRFVPLGHYPDYHPEFSGGKKGGRSMETGLFDTKRLGDWAPKLRRSPVFGATAMTVTEATTWDVFSNPLALPFQKLATRFKEGMVGYGASLAGFLFEACLKRGIEPLLHCRAQELVVDDGRVVGLQAVQDGEALRIRARRGVILASGGFEWNESLKRRFLGVPLTHPNSPPANEGDGLKMAMAVGADLGNMNEAWWCPSLVIPGEEYDGRQLNRGDFAVRSLPHSIIVNRRGERFVNEAHNYNDMMKPFFHFDPVTYERLNLPAHLVFDQSFLDRYMVLTAVPGQPAPDWLTRAESLEELAEKIGVSREGLHGTVERFNKFAQNGKDEDFGRGDSVYDHFYGDSGHAPNPNLGTIAKPPYYAIEVHPGAIGTKGGARITPHGQVQHVSGGCIPGLYAAGNVMAGVTGPGYPGAGATIAAAMTFGFLAAQHAVNATAVAAA